MRPAELLLIARFSKLALCLGMLAGVCGCSHLQVMMGMRVSLPKLQLASMDVSLPKNPGVAPGEKSPLVATFTQPDGKVLVTSGKGKGKVMWRDLAVTSTIVSVNKKGIVSLARDPRLSDMKMGHVSITVPSHPGLQAEIDVPVRYDYPFVSSYSGSSGFNGTNGTDGSTGSSGSDGSMDPNNPSPGGNGGNGGNGSDGTDGGDGGNGPAVQVRVTLRPGTHPLLQASVQATGHKTRFYLVDPQGGSLTVKSVGGSGGSGGKGGSGGRGGSGGMGTPSGFSGSNGLSGSDGRNGSDGRGGSITVTYDPQVKPFLNLIQLSNPGGPRPVFEEEPVAPLW